MPFRPRRRGAAYCARQVPRLERWHGPLEGDAARSANRRGVTVASLVQKQDVSMLIHQGVLCPLTCGERHPRVHTRAMHHIRHAAVEACKSDGVRQRRGAIAPRRCRAGKRDAQLRKQPGYNAEGVLTVEHEPVHSKVWVDQEGALPLAQPMIRSKYASVVHQADQRYVLAQRLFVIECHPCVRDAVLAIGERLDKGEAPENDAIDRHRVALNIESAHKLLYATNHPRAACGREDLAQLALGVARGDARACAVGVKLNHHGLARDRLRNCVLEVEIAPHDQPPRDLHRGGGRDRQHLRLGRHCRSKALRRERTAQRADGERRPSVVDHALRSGGVERAQAVLTVGHDEGGPGGRDRVEDGLCAERVNEGDLGGLAHEQSAVDCVATTASSKAGEHGHLPARLGEGGRVIHAHRRMLALVEDEQHPRVALADLRAGLRARGG
ncbi:hypothetical protein T492DRAFT_1125340 [Pavlovales sp. CCMP2436]|nr:hypothetical protein T492DRAFT_1125340 [Pavlovales sp. CCMP2436]